MSADPRWRSVVAAAAGAVVAGCVVVAGCAAVGAAGFAAEGCRVAPRDRA